MVLIDRETARTLIDERVPPASQYPATVYTTKTGGRIYVDEEGYLLDENPRPPAVDNTIEVPF